MRYSLRWYLLTLLCWPVLLWQGKRVRKLALRLPEANGKRYGEHGMGKPLRLLICGDSAAAGVGIADQQDALSGHLINQLSGAHQLQWQLHAKTGFSSKELVNMLQALPAQKFDVVVVSIGVNDVTALRSAQAYRIQIQQLMSCIHSKFADPFAEPIVLFSAIPDMQQFIALPSPLNHWLGIKAAELNQVLHSELVNWPKAIIVNAEMPLTEDMFAADGFHPSALGCAIWAQKLSEAFQLNKSLCISGTL
ncbi:SGNH/GDSL hydrolase family protein [Rheinheimera salexigens]|uniref:G-D-S-L lipolytic protein n=1 Tax=Rheinheimera salexigens TaxID=1628148 RepID=A0A1E7Q665_9GAMM|nr:SGNH/GDSL hydrolase family protein [Rheinheimera salexigens]OEY69665.1 G-D-S-L lipolytic protein [Rheinheimera salexigens]